MSIKGFNIGGVTQKYDYNALDNIPKGEGLSEEAKQALLQLAQKVAYIDDQGQTYYDDLYDAFYPPKTVVLITAVFEQGSTVIYDDTALDDLKQYLTVTAKYDDNTTAILADSAYTLSGLLEAGTSTVTVAYNGLTTTFTVNVTARPTLSSISAVYTQSGTVYDTDTLDTLKADLVVTAHYSDSSTEPVPAADYTLSGTLVDGTSTITVSYGGKTATFNVTVIGVTVFNGAYMKETSYSTPNVVKYFADTGARERMAWYFPSGAYAITKGAGTTRTPNMYPAPIPAEATHIFMSGSQVKLAPKVFFLNYNSGWKETKSEWTKENFDIDITDINSGSLYLLVMFATNPSSTAINDCDTSDWVVGWY